MGKRLIESVKRIDNCYFTYSLNDLGILLRNNSIKGELIRIAGFPYSGLYGINTNCTLIHYDIAELADEYDLLDEGDTGDTWNVLHFYSIYDDDIQDKLDEAEFMIEQERKITGEDDVFNIDTVYTSLISQAHNRYEIAKTGDLLLGHHQFPESHTDSNPNLTRMKQKKMIRDFYNI